MQATPNIVPVSELRRDIARLIEKARRSPEPIFITQRGYITAVLLTPEEYEDLRDAGRTEQERRQSALLLNDRRINSRLYGPWDWETARLTGENDFQEGEGEEEGEEEFGE